MRVFVFIFIFSFCSVAFSNAIELSQRIIQSGSTFKKLCDYKKMDESGKEQLLVELITLMPEKSQLEVKNSIANFTLQTSNEEKQKFMAFCLKSHKTNAEKKCMDLYSKNIDFFFHKKDIGYIAKIIKKQLTSYQIAYGDELNFIFKKYCGQENKIQFDDIVSFLDPTDKIDKLVKAGNIPEVHELMTRYSQNLNIPKVSKRLPVVHKFQHPEYLVKGLKADCHPLDYEYFIKEYVLGDSSEMVNSSKNMVDLLRTLPPTKINISEK